MSNINVQVAEVNDAFFNPRLADNPCVSRYNLRKADFANTMTDIYEFILVAEAEDGVEMKATRNTGAAVDMHSAREQDLCTFVYQVDERRDDPGVPIAERQPLTFTGIFLGHVTEEDYRHNERGERGTRTATLSKDGLSSYRRSLNLPML